MLALLKQHGWNSTSFQILESGFRYWFDGDDACVAYVEVGGAWVAAGAPVAAPTRIVEVAERFVAAARAEGRRCTFFAAGAPLVETGALDALQIGEQPVWDPVRWDETVAESRNLREQLRRARAKGVVVRPLAPDEVRTPDAPMRLRVEMLIRRWLHARVMAPMGFLVDVEPFNFFDERRYWVAEQGGETLGFLAAVPVYARGGWLFEDFLRDPAAPNGTAELLIDAAMRAVAAEGSRYVTLGLAPLAGDVSNRLKLARRLSGALYDFSGLAAFKSKLRPHAWEPIYLTHARGGSGNLALYDALAAFARGSFVRFGAATLVRGPAVVVRLLTALLVPWTVLLALAGPRWFPAPWAQHGWLAFDVGLIGSAVRAHAALARLVGRDPGRGHHRRRAGDAGPGAVVERATRARRTRRNGDGALGVRAAAGRARLVGCRRPSPTSAGALRLSGLTRVGRSLIVLVQARSR